MFTHPCSNSCPNRTSDCKKGCYDLLEYEMFKETSPSTFHGKYRANLSRRDISSYYTQKTRRKTATRTYLKEKAK